VELLLLYFFLAVGLSFLCSILESVFLSTSLSYVSVLERERPKVGAILLKLKKDTDKSIAAILILNTIANTLGAAAVGAQAGKLFGSEAVFWVSTILTFAILFFSEIIPKTIGATFWKQLAPVSAYIIQFLIYLTYPVILITQFVTKHISKGNDAHIITREELIQSTILSEGEGIIDKKESGVIENVLSLDEIKVSDILTPRSVVFALDENRTISDIVEHEEQLYGFSRIPVYDHSVGIDQITGLVLTKEIFRQSTKDPTVPLAFIRQPIFSINENIPVSKTLDMFIKRKEHMFLVLDNYDQTDGIVTLEDCIETLLGVEIVDESDTIEDMRALAKQKMKDRRKAIEKKLKK
jgi:CBS domain containing-hemolysin-like protein